MKILHLSDLHLGKRLGEISLIPDQQYMLNELIQIARSVDTVIIAGDIYDKSAPPADAMGLFDMFITHLAQMDKNVLVISGNHDSPGRIAFGRDLFNSAGVYICPVYDGTVQAVTLNDEYGEIDFYMLPFIKPAHVRRAFPQCEPDSYNEAVKLAVEKIGADYSRRCVMIAHQFITGAGTGGSEQINVGGLDNVDAGIFSGFDYVALGHIHKKQNIAPNCRYCGTMLKYSLAEADDVKTASIITIEQKGHVSIDQIPLKPLHDLRRIKGSFESIISRTPENQQDYIHILLTDENYVPEAINRLRRLYPNIVHLEYSNTYQSKLELMLCENTQQLDPLDLFYNFYFMQNGSYMNSQQQQYIKDLFSGLDKEEGQ